MWVGKIKDNVGVVVAGIGLIGALFAFDGRYEKAGESAKIMTAAKNEIIHELRSEVSTNRGVLILNMQRDADDLEFQISEYENKNEIAPRYIIEKHKAIVREIETLKKDEKPNN